MKVPFTEKFLGLKPEEFSLSPSLSQDIQALDAGLGGVLGEMAPEVIHVARALMQAKSVEDIKALDSLKDPALVRSVARAFTVLFQLINAAEQKEIVRVNRARSGKGQRRESIFESIANLAENGYSAEEVQSLLDKIQITPTLTAHPTEAKRKAVLDKLQAITLSLQAIHESPGLDDSLDSQTLPGEELHRTLIELWQTDEMRDSQLTVEEEVRNALYFFERTILKVLPWLQRDLELALQTHFPNSAFNIPSIVNYRSWVGGDRDGNPNVTPELTWQTLLEHRQLILETYLLRTTEIRKRLTQSIKLVSVSEELVQTLSNGQSQFPIRPDHEVRYSQEPYVRLLLRMEMRLGNALDQTESMLRVGRTGGYEMRYLSPEEFLSDIDVIRRSLRENGAVAIADTGPLPELEWTVKACGFHLASLDVRQHSDEHEKAISELFTASGMTTHYASLSEKEKTSLLVSELQNPRPLSPVDFKGTEMTHRAVEIFRVIRKAKEQLSPNAVQTYIISMTHGISDILEVLVLAKEAGISNELDVVPLFETIDDLAGCANLLDELFNNPVYRAHVSGRNDFQEIMLGYSDSSKDGGFLAANWALQSTLTAIAQAGTKFGITTRLFHGRGGTVGRGGGRANKAILSQPVGAFNGQIRFTEQGEVISFRYSLPPIAHRHLEQIVSACLTAASRTSGIDPEEKFGPRMQELAETSRKAYRDLVYQDPDFWTFYSQATPIEFISLLPIASRPVFRPGKALASIEGLRAIPWNFAWVQSRYVLVGWYGIGAAFESFAAGNDENLATLREMYNHWPFFKTVLDNAQLELKRAEFSIAKLYASRCQPAVVGKRIHALIEEEHSRTIRWVLAITEQQDLLEHAKVVRSTVNFRNPATTPLSLLQLALMDEWSSLTDEQQSGVYREAMLQTIAGLAAAMQSTG